jgi:E3 ubiquitin-protein ligase SHPRH
MPLRKSSATLIISPQSIQHQWEAEIKSHAPDLRVHIYQGLKAAGRDASSEEILETLLGYDVVLVSYNVLSAEIHFAEATPEKNLRYKKQYEKRTSPLVQIDWWRCVLDECQMVESGVSQAARVANQISRQKAWAVSGTPLKKDAKDLFGLLVFLRLEPYNYSQSVWRRLIEHHKPIFKRLFGDIAIRHSKNLVRADIILPPQKRVVITLPLTPIEEQHYFEVYQEMCDDLSVSLEGVPLNNDWDPNKPASIEKMRAWLSRLRQTVLHPEVGERNRRALGQKDGPLRTVEAVLDVMIEKNDAEIRSAERAYFMAKVWRGKILERGKRLEEALEIWLEAFDSASQAVRECRYELDASSGNEAQEGDVSSTAERSS